MTTTPESWDDVGCLRLQVDCLSHKVEDLEECRNGPAAFYGVNDSQLQELRDKVELQEQRHQKERCLRDIIAVLFGCVLALLFVIFMVFMIETRSTQRLSNDALEATRLLPATFVLNASGFKWRTHLPVTQTSKDKHEHNKNGQELKQKPVNNAGMKPNSEEESPVERQHPERNDIKDKAEKMEFFENMMRPRKLWEQTPKAVKNDRIVSETVVEKREPEAKQIPEVQSARLPELSAKTEGRAHRVTTKDPEDVRDVEVERQSSIKSTQDQLSPVTDHTRPPLPSQSHGVLWACFPASTSKRDFQKYASTLIEVSRSQRWMVYPFCFIDRSSWKYNEWGDHFCDDDDDETFTFVMEKSTSIVDSEIEDIPTQSRIDECRHYMKTSPEYFQPIKKSKQSVHRQTFQPDQDIQPSLVEDFLYDVYSGMVPEVIPVKPPRRDNEI